MRAQSWPHFERAFDREPHDQQPRKGALYIGSPLPVCRSLLESVDMKRVLALFALLSVVPAGCGSSAVGPTVFSGITNIAYNPNNPALSLGNSGAFDTGALQDMKLIRTHGTKPHEYYMFYTGAAVSGTPYNPSVGLAHSDDGLIWTKDGQVIPPHGNCGGVFSPGAYYDYSGSGSLYVYVSCTAKASQWYSGPISIYSIIVASGQDWANSANYAWQPGPSLSQTQGWEGSQGVYAPDVVKIGSMYSLFYSSAASGGGNWNIGLATSTTPIGPWTKYSANPITTSGVAEEPAISQLENGTLMMFSDTLAFNLGRGVSIYTTPSPSGQASPWQWQFARWTDAGTWDGNHVGSQSIVEMADGRWLLAWGGNAGGGDQIGTAFLTFQANLTFAQQTGHPRLPKILRRGFGERVSGN
jgi:predicted GH43/DUF377 family glycosyl hydrolase